MFIVAQILSLMGMLSNIVALQLKTKRQILITILIGNILFLISYILLEAYIGSIICGFNAMIVFINSLLEEKGKSTPKPIIVIYIIIAIAFGITFFDKVIDMLPIIASILLILSLMQNKEKNIRLLLLIGFILWLIYDFYFLAYMACISDLFTIISSFVAIYRYDMKQIKTSH